jgi:multisubunit Na+/H+ antiporter MnhB subunit
LVRWKPPDLGLVAIAGIAVAIGLLPLPYEYYVLLRVFLCGVSLYFLAGPSACRDWEKWVLVGLIVLHNPIVSVPFGSPSTWSLINIATVIWFWHLDRRRR